MVRSAEVPHPTGANERNATVLSLRIALPILHSCASPSIILSCILAIKRRLNDLRKEHAGDGEIV